MELTGSASAETAAKDSFIDLKSDVVVRVLRVDVGELSLEDLDDRVEVLARARSQIEGQLAEVLAERAQRSSPRAASAVLRERVLESAGRASSDVKLAVSLSEQFPATLEALAAGEITSSHARVIDRVAGKPDYRSEEVILGAAKGVPADLLSRYALRWERVEERDYTKYEQQRQDRRASISQEPDGSWKLFAHFDYMAGRRVSMALAKMAEAFRRDENPDSKITYLQRNADALKQLITRDGPQRATQASLLIISEYDASTGELSQPRLDDGQPVPPEELERLLANADVYTAFADADGQPLWLGRSQRSASLAQRIVLAARDGGCIGCNAPSERCEAHHIQHWQDDGPTDIPNLAQLCPGCHHLVHDCNWQVCQNHRGRLQINAPPDPFPDTGTTTYQLAQHSPVLRN
ncbi:DUF222 domain-containing protein [Candidatus Poriferisocius sp.]|uniref:HNH endonuclease signature motif containing protein n=1 Tax=Candidatus Poriferisocius sp. TaxID=3101276 RepID=UPI003B5ADB57